MRLIYSIFNIILFLWLFLTVVLAHNSSSVEVKLNGTQILAALTSNPIHHIVGRVVDFFRHLVGGSKSKHTVETHHHNVTNKSTSIMKKSCHHRHHHNYHYGPPSGGFDWFNRIFGFNFGSGFGSNFNFDNNCNCDDCNCDDFDCNDCNCDDCWGRPPHRPPHRSTTTRRPVTATTVKPGSTPAKPGSKLPTCHCDCGVANHAPLARIVGGTPIRPNEYPWLVRIDYRSKFHCGGSLINKDYVLTAAHCVENRIRSGFLIVLGEHNRLSSSSETESRGVSEIVSHARYNDRNMHNDIALLRLNRPVEFSKVIRPVCQPSKDMAFGGKTGSIVGWGTTSEQGEASQFPLQADVPVYNHVQCRRFNYRPSEISNKMICAGGNSKDTCQGDSGGPLQLKNDNGKYILAGVVSWGNGCGRPGYPGVYTNAAKYQDWILDNMRDTCICVS